MNWFLQFCDVCSAVSVDFLVAMFACGYSRVRVAAFFEKTGTVLHICC